jgi:hypothetical protein
MKTIKTIDLFEENDVSAFEFVEDLDSCTVDEPLLNIYIVHIEGLF